MNLKSKLWSHVWIAPEIKKMNLSPAEQVFKNTHTHTHTNTHTHCNRRHPISRTIASSTRRPTHTPEQVGATWLTFLVTQRRMLLLPVTLNYICTLPVPPALFKRHQCSHNSPQISSIKRKHTDWIWGLYTSHKKIEKLVKGYVFVCFYGF